MIDEQLDKIDHDTQHLFMPIASKLNNREHYTLLHFDIHGRVWTQYNSLRGAVFLKDAEGMVTELITCFLFELTLLAMKELMSS